MIFEAYKREYALAGELANSRLPERPPDEDLLNDVAGLASLLKELDWPAGPLTGADLDEVRSLRQRIEAVFDAPDQSTAAGALNELLVELHLTPTLEPDDDGALRLRFAPAGDGLAERLGAVAATGLASVLVESGVDRFGRCASETCEDVFVDNTKNRSRRYCSDGCANRSGVRAHRARAREA